MRKIALLCFVVAVLALARPAYAVLTSDNTNIGAHPSYGSGYSAFWRTGFDYSVITDGTHTYVNAPVTTGAIIFRGNNTASPGITSPDGFPARAFIDKFSGFSVAGTITGQGGVVGRTVSGDGVVGNASGAGGTGVYGIASSSTGIGVYGNGSVAGAIGVYGVSSGSTTAAVYAQSACGPTCLAYYGAGNITITGDTATKLSAGSWVGTSDIRTKKNVEPYVRGLEAIALVEPIAYSYNGLGGTVDDGKRYVGVSAQALREVAPSMVSTRRVGEMDVLQVDPSELTWMLVNSVKELDAEVKSLRDEVRTLKAVRR